MAKVTHLSQGLCSCCYQPSPETQHRYILKSQKTWRTGTRHPSDYARSFHTSQNKECQKTLKIDYDNNIYGMALIE